MSSTITFGELIDVANKGLCEATAGNRNLLDCWDDVNDVSKNADMDAVAFLVVTELQQTFEMVQLAAFTVEVQIAPAVKTYAAAITSLKDRIAELNAVIGALENGILNETLFNPVLKPRSDDSR